MAEQEERRKRNKDLQTSHILMATLDIEVIFLIKPFGVQTKTFNKAFKGLGSFPGIVS